MKTAIILALGAAILTTPAFASHHPTQAANEIIDEASVAPYPIETVAPLRRGWYHHRPSSVGALRRSRSRRTHVSRHFDKRPRPAEEGRASAHSAPPVRHEAEVPKVAPDALALAAGALVGIAEGFADGIATAMPALAVPHAPSRIKGELRIGDLRVPFGSGGEGWSLDYGDYPITPKDIGPWGSRHGAIGLAGDEIYDRRLGRDREGIELHAATNDSLMTEGCVAIARREWIAVKRAVLAMIDMSGHAYLHIDPTGARIEPNAEPVVMLASAEGTIEGNYNKRYNRESAQHYHKQLKVIHWHHRYASHRHLRRYAAQ